MGYEVAKLKTNYLKWKLHLFLFGKSFQTGCCKVNKSFSVIFKVLFFNMYENIVLKSINQQVMVRRWGVKNCNEKLP